MYYPRITCRTFMETIPRTPCTRNSKMSSLHRSRLINEESKTRQTYPADFGSVRLDPLTSFSCNRGTDKPGPPRAPRVRDASKRPAQEGKCLQSQSNASGWDEIYLRPFPNIDSGRW